MAKIFMLLISIVVSVPAFAAQTFYNCKSEVAVDVGLPVEIMVEIDGPAVRLQNVSDDVYYTGHLIGPAINDQGERIAVGFSGLISDGYVIVGHALIKRASSGSIVVADEALDSTKIRYSCQKNSKAL